MRGGVRTETILPFHKCTEEDFSEFNEIAPLQKQRFEDHKEKNGFYCIDWDDDNPLLIYGYEGDSDYARLDFRLGPCNEISFTPDIHPECNYDLEKQLEYLSSVIKLNVLHNNERF